MSTENNFVSKTAALGRPFQLGMLYDLTTDELNSNALLWNSDIIKACIYSRSSPSRTCEIHAADRLTQKADLLGLDTHLKMSILTDLVEFSGSAQLLNTRKTTQHKRSFLFKYSQTTHCHELAMAHLPEYHLEKFNGGPNATHVVVGILYGIEICFIFDRMINEDEDNTKIDNNVLKLLEKMTIFKKFDLDENEEKIAQLLTCKYYGDVNLKYEPRTFKQAARFFTNLSEYLDINPNNTIPKQVWIYPIYSTDQRIHLMNYDVVFKSFQLIERLHGIEMIINDLRYSFLANKSLDLVRQQLSRSFDRIQEFEVVLKKKMRKFLVDIRQGIEQEHTLINFLNNLELLFLNQEKLKHWIELITRNSQIFIRIFNQFNEQMNNNRSDTEFTLCFSIHLIEKNDPFVTDMFEFLNENVNRQYHRNLNQDYWFNQEKFVFIRNKIGLFREFAEINREKKNVKFIVQQQYADEFQMNKDVSILLYQYGTAKNFEIPSKPRQPYATDIKYRNLTLNWSPPMYGNCSIQKYKIFAQISTYSPWTLVLTTTDPVQSAIISNLPPGKYQFQVQGVTLIGVTAMSDSSDVIELQEAPPPPPPPKIEMPSPVVTAYEVTSKKVILDVTPAWFEPVKSVDPKKIRFPTNYDRDSPVDRRTYDCLSSYRSMVKEKGQIDFVAEPFRSNVESTETLVVILNELAHVLGARLTFTHKNFQYDDSDYRTACGVTNLGSIHSLLASEGNFLTARFDLHFKLNYDDVTASKEALQKYILTFIHDMANIIRCNKDFIRVFSVSRVSSILVGVGITTPQLDETKKVADLLQQKLHRVSPEQRQDVFHYLIPESYDYKLEPALTFLQLQQSDFEPHYNRAYPNAHIESRGGYPYHFPQGWFRHALQVVDKYPNDQRWLGMNNSKGEWAVAYHGTRSTAARGVVDQGFLQRYVTHDLCKVEAERKNPGIPNVRGIYVATHCEGGAANYAESFEVKDSTNTMRSYQLVFQCRVQPGKFTEHKSPVTVGMAWRVFNEKAIRPYGLLLRRSSTKKS